MISTFWLGDGFIPFLCWTLICWMFGVAWAAYRAVGWVERMRAWAASVALSEAEDSAVTAFVPAESGTDSGRNL